MKTYFVITFLFVASAVMGQSLKDSLYKGRLKNPLAKTAAPKDSTMAKDSLKTIIAKDDNTVPVTAPTEDKTVAAEAVKPDDNSMPDSLNKLYYAKQKNWKRFIDQQTLNISAQADESRKVKKGEYYIEFDYEVGLNGRVKVSNITCSPKNEFVLETVTDILSRPPVLAPPIYGDGKPRVATARQQMTILKK